MKPSIFAVIIETIGILFLAVIVGIAVVFVSSCGSVKSELKPIENGEIACLQAEASTLSKQVSVVQVALDVVEAIATAITGDPSGAVDQLIAKYSPTLGPAAEATVACAVKALAGQDAPASGNLKAAKPDPRATAAKQVIAKHGWRFK